MNKRILISLSVIGAVAAMAVGGTVAYFRDTETSPRNTFTAGVLNLEIGLTRDGTVVFPLKDLTGDRLFNYTDVKPGDKDKLTLSAHVSKNDACGRFRIYNIVDDDRGCVNPETKAGDTSCAGAASGELDDHLRFRIWVDWGTTPGWQCPRGTPRCAADPQEGDNIRQAGEPFITRCRGTEWCLLKDIDPKGETWDLYKLVPSPHNYLLASKTFYVGFEWELPPTTGNIVQSDKWSADMDFMVVQRKNNEKCENW